MTDYEKQAQDFLSKHGLTLKIADGDCKPVPWGGRGGDHYRVTIRRPESSLGDVHSLSFDFWGSEHDMMRGVDPSAYDVLACISMDSSAPTDPDEVAEEYGDMKPSQAIKVAKFARRLQNFFTEEELDDLQTIS